MLTLLTFIVILCAFLMYKGEDYFSIKGEEYFLIERARIIDEKDKNNDDNTDKIVSEDDNRIFRKKLDRYWKCKRVCEECWPLAILIAAAFVMAEATAIGIFIGTAPTRLEKKIEDCQIQNAAFESSIVEILVQDAKVNENESENEKIDLEKSFDYALIYLMRHPELNENKNFAKQFSFYQENYDKIQEYKSNLELHDKFRFLLYFGR